MEERSSDTPPSGTSAAARLESWKEIAAYVKRDVTTVQRWEKREGMPVHRHLHDKRGSVYAFSSELDEWLQSRRLRLEQEEEQEKDNDPDSAANGESEDVLPELPQPHLQLVLSGIAALVLILVAYLVIKNRENATPPKITS